VDWIFDNIFIIAIIGSAIARWLSGLKEDSSDSSSGERPARGAVDVEQAERNRRLREEIRRKREQRRGGQTVAPAEAVEPAKPAYDPHLPEQQQIPPILREMLGIPQEPQTVVVTPTPPPVPEVNPVLDRQQRMEQEMAELEIKRREADALARKAGVGQGGPRRRRAKSTSDLSERDFLATLRNPQQARRAILLREILGKPVGLR